MATGKPGMLDTMLHVIRGMKDPGKLSKVLGATVARCAIVNGYEQTARELEALAGELRRQPQ